MLWFDHKWELWLLLLIKTEEADNIDDPEVWCNPMRTKWERRSSRTSRAFLCKIGYNLGECQIQKRKGQRSTTAKWFMNSTITRFVSSSIRGYVWFNGWFAVLFCQRRRALTMFSLVFPLQGRLHRVKDYEQLAGAKLFERYELEFFHTFHNWIKTIILFLTCWFVVVHSYSLFEHCPRAKTLFGYPHDITTKELLSSKRFVMHGAYLIQMLDSALDLYVLFLVVLLHGIRLMTFPFPDTHVSFLTFFFDRLGPDVELLTEIMSNLGTKHVRYGVTVDMFPFMGISLIETLEEILGSSVMNEAAKEAWLETFADLTEDMIKVMTKRTPWQLLPLLHTVRKSTSVQTMIHNCVTLHTYNQ